MIRSLAVAFIAPTGLCSAGFQALAPDVHLWQDTCHVHVLKHGDSAVLINAGDGSVLEHLGEIGVKRVDWLIFTDHHREVSCGALKLDRSVTKIAASEVQKELLESPLS